MEELEQVLHDEPRAKSFISPYVASKISELSVILECLHQLHQFQPWAKKIETSIVERRNEPSTCRKAHSAAWGPIIKSVFSKDPKLAHLGNPEDGKFYYPSQKRRTRATVEAMRVAESALDAYWKAANDHILRHAGTTPEAETRESFGTRTLLRTLPWVEPSKKPDSTARSDAFIQPIPRLAHDIDQQITGAFKKLSTSTTVKSKTRGSVLPAVEPAEEPVRELVTPEEPVLIVNSRAHKVFRALFHSPNSPDQPGVVNWAEFLYAMTSVGFSAEKRQGSAWHFAPNGLNVERCIQFHEPHPGNKLPFTTACRYGCRLTRAFGWSGNTFRLA
jgi:hypothetical protein